MKDKPTQKRRRGGVTENKGSSKRQRLLVQIRHFHFFLFLLYLPTGAREEDPTVIVFVPQLLGNTGEAGAGLRGIPRLHRSEARRYYTEATARISPLVN